MQQTVWVAFRVGDLMLALPRECIGRILPIPTLNRSPNRPAAIEGILDLAGCAVPVVRLDRLLGLPPIPRHPYQHLLVLRDVKPVLALLVERATEILRIPPEVTEPLSSDETFNGCVTALYSAPGSTQIHLLSCERLLRERERLALIDYQTIEQRRLAELGSAV